MKNNSSIFKIIRVLFIILLDSSILMSGEHLSAQPDQDVIVEEADLATCLKYAMAHQPLIQQLRLSEDITRQEAGIALSDWLPQIDANAGLQRYINQPVSIFPDFTNPSGPEREITIGVKNTSSLQFSVSQVLFNNDVFIAGKTARYYRLQSTQTTTEMKIDLVVRVSKAFYDVLLSEANLDFLNEDIIRIGKSMKDAYSQYESGVSDKIDYQRALISLNNTKAEIYGTRETIKAKYTYLKELMGYPQDKPLTIVYDSFGMLEQAGIDTSLVPVYQNRIEYELLRTQLRLQRFSISHSQLGFLPALSVFGNYNIVYQNDNFSDLYDRSFPNSTVGLSLSYPLFEGTRKLRQVKMAKLQYDYLALDSINLKNSMKTEFSQAMSSYKSYLKAYEEAKENAKIAKEVYSTVKYQYDQGIKTFLEVIVSETDLRTSRINELNALYRLLAGKLDVERALGNISVNY